MKVDIEELIKERKATHWGWCYDIYEDPIVDNAIAKNEKEFAVILCPSALKHARERVKCVFPGLKRFYVTGIFDIGLAATPREKYGLEYTLITFSVEKPKQIKICAIPRDQVEDWTARTRHVRENLDYKAYYKDLELFINTSKVPASLSSLTNLIPYADYQEENFDVRCYSKKYLGCLKSLKKQKVICLKDLVEIIDGRENSDDNKESKFLNLQFWSYPLKIEKLPLSRGGCPLKSGDIVGICSFHFGAFYLFVENTKTTVSAGIRFFVLRLKSNLVTPEYLFLYMKSNLFKILSAPILSNEAFLVRPDLKLIEKLPVVLPNSEVPMALNKELSQKYRDLFNEKYRPYLVKKSDYYANVQRPQKKVVHEDAVLDEYLEGLKKAHKRELLYFINENMREMNVCISGKAYNTAIVVTGSILEAVLTDWLGEIKGKNYFKKPFRTVNENGRNQHRYLSLNDAISQIAKIMKKWNEKEKAIAIRELRNRVHARVFMEQNKKITKSECETAQKNLNSVIKSRYSDFEMKEMN